VLEKSVLKKSVLKESGGVGYFQLTKPFPMLHILLIDREVND